MLAFVAGLIRLKPFAVLLEFGAGVFEERRVGFLLQPDDDGNRHRRVQKSGQERSEFPADPTDGSLFIFINRRRDRMKLLHFDGGGYWLYYRLLEAGTFEQLQATDNSRKLQIDATQLSMLLSGVSLVAAKNRRKRYSDQAA